MYIIIKNMLLVALIVCISSIVLYMGFNTVKTTNEKILMIIACIIIRCYI